MKKTISIICFLLFILALPLNVFAQSNRNQTTLEDIAEEIIITEADYSSANPIITYSQIEKFVNTVHKKLPATDNLDIGKFIMSYTCQNEVDVDDNEALKYLNFKEITVFDEYLKVDASGNSESITKKEAETAAAIANLGISTYDIWTSNNGYMQIKTVISRETGVVNGYVGYQIATYGTWLNMPICFFEDVLSLYYSRDTFDANHEVYGKLEETFNCCGSTKDYKTQVWNNKNKDPYYTNKNVVVEYSTDKAVTIRFKLLPASSYQCTRSTSNHSKAVTRILSYMSYGIHVKAGERFQIQGAYGHKRLSAGKIGVSVSGSGISLSSSAGAIFDKYIAAPYSFTAYK